MQVSRYRKNFKLKGFDIKVAVPLSINFFRNKIWKLFTGADNAVLSNKVSLLKSLEEKFYDIKESGLYLHIPFCRQICPYCPYNKELYCNRIKICIINSIWNHPSHIISNLSLPKS